MINRILKRRQPGAEATEGTTDLGYDIMSARLPGRSIIAFEKKGRATALEVTDRGTEILRGLAAGAILSELDEVRERSGFGDGADAPLTRADGLSLAATEAFIDGLDVIDGSEKRELLGALPR